MTNAEYEAVMETVVDATLRYLPVSFPLPERVFCANLVRREVARQLAASKPPEVVS